MKAKFGDKVEASVEKGASTGGNAWYNKSLGLGTLERRETY